MSAQARGVAGARARACFAAASACFHTRTEYSRVLSCTSACARICSDALARLSTVCAFETHNRPATLLAGQKDRAYGVVRSSFVEAYGCEGSTMLWSFRSARSDASALCFKLTLAAVSAARSSAC
eukprot:6200125-Pleurochrysis_carterae.AAC.1